MIAAPPRGSAWRARCTSAAQSVARLRWQDGTVGTRGVDPPFHNRWKARRARATKGPPRSATRAWMGGDDDLVELLTVLVDGPQQQMVIEDVEVHVVVGGVGDGGEVRGAGAPSS